MLHEQSKSKSTVFFIVTGFGSFGSVLSNPTTDIANKLCGYISSKRSQINQKDSHPQVQTKVFKTSAKSVEQELNQLYQDILDWKNFTLPISSPTRSSFPENSDENNRKIVVVLHLGVHIKATKFRLERCAYNEATFRIPDEDGYSPSKISIHNDHPFGECFVTELDVNRLHCELSTRSISRNLATNDSSSDVCCGVEISVDPGRFVCNYTYCYSLKKCAAIKNNCEKEIGPGRLPPLVYSLFLHVPPFSVASEELQLSFITDLIHAIEHQLNGDHSN